MFDSLGISERAGTRFGVAKNITATNSVRAARGYQMASLFCSVELLAVAAKKASLTTSRSEIIKRTYVPYFEAVCAPEP